MGFYRIVFSLKRAARFFFYCQNVVQVFFAVFSVVNEQAGMAFIEDKCRNIWHANGIINNIII